MSCNILQTRCRLASSVQILRTRLQNYVLKKKIIVSPREVMWIKIWAQVASQKLGKTRVETVPLKLLLDTAKIEAYKK